MRRMKLSYVYAVFLSLLIFIPTPSEAKVVKAPHVDVSLIAPVKAFQRGTSAWIAIRQDIEPHWHTYWRNAGDSGMPPKVKWQVPQGVKVGKAHWPYPLRIKVGPLVNFGYEGTILLLYKLNIPKTYKENTISIKGEASWLVCQEECIPGKASLSLTLPVVSNKPDVNTETKPLFETTLKHLPKPFQGKADAKERKDSFVIRIQGQKGAFSFAKTILFFPNKGALLTNAKLPTLKREGDQLTFIFDKNEYFAKSVKRLDGMLLLSDQPQTSHIIKAKPAKPKEHAESKPASQPTGVCNAFHGRIPENAKVLTYAVSMPVKVLQKKLAAAPVAAKKLLPAAKDSGVVMGQAVGEKKADLTLWMALFWAFLGGLILNLMPCVFPVLSIKILQFVEQANEEPRQIRLHGLAFWAGVQVSFSVLAGALIALRAGGQLLGWGFQLQNPAFVLAVTVVLFAMALSLSGLFEIGNSLMNTGSGLAGKEGYGGSFFTGVLATIVATPCTAPFMGAAIGFALSQGSVVGLLVFNGLALGMATPYVLLSFFPKGLAWIPRPGAWMEVFKQVMAFPLYATVIWLVWVLGMQTGIPGMLQAMISLLVVAMGGWFFSLTALRSRVLAWSGNAVLVLSLVGPMVWGGMSLRAQTRPLQTENRVSIHVSNAAQAKGQKKRARIPFRRKTLNGLLKKGKIVFLNFTADWCITCKANEKTTLSTKKAARLFAKHDVHYVRGDWTNGDKEITKTLEQFKRNGVPLYVMFNGTKTYKVLPQILTPQILRNGLKDVGVTLKK
ncbi:MAG: thiol:disulfide interchange protein [Deltaproteobacteria bacterium]|nr:thiol:disulfide interchange protein [Deltaproteobacteria bacterium]